MSTIYRVERISESLWSITRGHNKVGFARELADGSYSVRIHDNTATHPKLFGALSAAAPAGVDLIMVAPSIREENPPADPSLVAALKTFLDEGDRRAKLSGRHPGRWLQMRRRWGDVEAVSRAVFNCPIPRVIAEDETLAGRLLEDGVARFAALFSNAVRQRARQRLEMLAA
jgi:hypothetical protein